MPQHERIVRRYALVGPVMESAPSHQGGLGVDAGIKPLSGMQGRSPMRPHRTGQRHCSRLVALLTEIRIAAPSVVTAAAMWRHARRRHLREFHVELTWEQEPSARCPGAVSAGGLMLLQWQSQARLTPNTLALPSRWVLEVEMKESWHVPSVQAPTEVSVLLVQDTMVPPV